MPELPEVEYVARQLRKELVGHRIRATVVSWPRSVSGLDPAEFATRMRDRLVDSVDRRGKYLLFALDDGNTLVVHRRMSGNLVLSPPAAADGYIRVAFALDDGRQLLYSDPRKFGRLALLEPGKLAARFAALGPEPLGDEFTPAVLGEQLAGRRRGLKMLLLDQLVVAGLGNIYADEALYRARLHPLRHGSDLTLEEVAALHAAIQGVLRTGIQHGGTTFGRHRDAYDEAGTNLDHLMVYRKTGLSCPHCGTPIQRIVVAQRGTHFCPSCQQLP